MPIPIPDDLHDKLSGDSSSLLRRYKRTMNSSAPDYSDHVVNWYHTRLRTRCSARLAMKEFSMKLPARRLPDLPLRNSKLRLLNEVIIGQDAKEKKMIKRHPDFATHVYRESFTDAEAKIYTKTIFASEGFDAPILPVMFCKQIYPLLKYSQYAKKNLRLGIRLAVKKYNEDERKNIKKVIEVTKANFQGWAPHNYYITFKAEDDDGGIKEYQTLLIIANKRSESFVHFVRLKPDHKKKWGPKERIHFWLC